MCDSAYSPFLAAQRQFDQVAELLQLDAPTRKLLREPVREFHFVIPVRLDDGTTEVFRGYRVQHNDARGPCQGGVRFHPEENIDAVRAQAMWMTWKSALVDIPLGGSRGGVICNPHDLSSGEQERLCRGWVRQLSRNLGPLSDVPSPDLMTNARHMLWMLDEYETICGAKYPGFITGKPVGIGGSGGRTEAAGYGVVFLLREALKELDIRIQDTTAAVQGFGNVAQHAIQLFDQFGGRVVCVSSWAPGEETALCYRKQEGIDLAELRGITNEFGDIDRKGAADLGYEVLPGEAWIEQSVDLLIPAALEAQLNAQNVQRVSDKVKVIAEGASGPTSPDADEVLKQRGVVVIPDFLANSGGVICSYFEQVQCNANCYWEKDEVLGKLDRKMTAAFIEVSELARKKQLSLRDAAYLIAVDRVANACRERGWI